MPVVKSRKFQVLIWRSESGLWFWQLNGSNGRMIAGCPATGYTSKRNAENAVESASHAFTNDQFDVRMVGDARKAA